MSLFRNNGKPILFHLINLEDAELAALTKLVEREGGGVTNDDNATVKFTTADAYEKNGPVVRAKIYDVMFIRECVRQKTIVKPEGYRLDERIGQDDFYVHHFLYGKCEDNRNRLQCHCQSQPQDNVRSQSVYSIETLPDSDTSMERVPSVNHELTDESQEVLSALELGKFTSSLAGGDPAASYSSNEKRPCNLEHMVGSKVKVDVHKIGDCATDNVESGRRISVESKDRGNYNGSCRNWYRKVNYPSEMEKNVAYKREDNDDWTRMELHREVALLSVIPQARMLSNDTCATSLNATLNGDQTSSMNETYFDGERNEAKKDRDSETPNLEFPPVTEENSGIVHTLDNKEPTDAAKGKQKVEKTKEPDANREKAKSFVRAKIENVNVHDNHEQDARTVQKQGTKKAIRRVSSFRKSRRMNYMSSDSSDSSMKGVTTSKRVPDNDSSTSASEPEIISDEDSADERPPQRRKYDESNVAGPSGVRNTRKSHVEDNGESNGGGSLVRNIAHPSFHGNPVQINDSVEDVEEPKGEYYKTNKNSRGKEWRAKLKSQTDAQFTGNKSRRPFTPSERRTMLRYLVKKKCISRAKGLVVWTQMITDGYLTDRTPQSLQNHFRKCILPNIEDASYLEDSDMQKFLTLRGDNDHT